MKMYEVEVAVIDGNVAISQTDKSGNDLKILLHQDQVSIVCKWLSAAAGVNLPVALDDHDEKCPFREFTTETAKISLTENGRILLEQGELQDRYQQAVFTKQEAYLIGTALIKLSRVE
jgi:hypothetical protein